MIKKARDESLTFAVWATAWGPMGAVAGAGGISRLVLPHYQFNELCDLLAWEHPGAQRDEGPFRRLIELSRDYFNGKVTDFADIVCDLPEENTFSGKVLRACRGIPYGASRSYHVLAEQIGCPDAARAVATALSKNAIPLVIPCHRVIYAGGGAGGFSSPGGPEQKKRMLAMEQAGIAKAIKGQSLP